MKKAPEMEQPLNANERFLYQVAIRLDVIIEQNNSIIEHLAKNDKVAVTNQKVETKIEKPAEKPAPRKRTEKK